MDEVGPTNYLKCIESTESDAYEILTGKQYSVKPEFAQELYHIISRLEQLRLDNNLLSTGNDARKSQKYNPSDMNKRYGETGKKIKPHKIFDSWKSYFNHAARILHFKLKL